MKMDLRKRLKIETQSLHDKVEQTFLLQLILKQEITLKDYKSLMEKFYGFIAPCEDLIGSCIHKSAINNRKKRPWLEQDLRALKISNLDDIKLQKCIDLPVFSEYEQVIGYLYVMEGATLGGQIISKILKNELQITQNTGARFFYGYGYETKNMWSDFCFFLNTITDTKQQNLIIHAASNTFNQFYSWLKRE